jgi:hypothetical protein
MVVGATDGWHRDVDYWSLLHRAQHDRGGALTLVGDEIDSDVIALARDQPLELPGILQHIVIVQCSIEMMMGVVAQDQKRSGE